MTFNYHGYRLKAIFILNSATLFTDWLFGTFLNYMIRTSTGKTFTVSIIILMFNQTCYWHRLEVCFFPYASIVKSRLTCLDMVQSGSSEPIPDLATLLRTSLHLVSQTSLCRQSCDHLRMIHPMKNRSIELVIIVKMLLHHQMSINIAEL